MTEHLQPRTSPEPVPQPAHPPVPAFSLREFAPSWGAAVMGTSALSVALYVAGEGREFAGLTTAAARVFLLIAVALGVAVLGVTGARWIRHADQALADLHHPVKGGMTATAAGGLLTLSVAIGKVGAGVLPQGVVLGLVGVLVIVGAALALLIGWEFLGEIFTSREASLVQVSGAWFVPPVVAIIVPLAMLPLIARYPQSASDLMALAWGFVGVGGVLYLVVTATLFVRSISHPLPPAALAPTLLIGMGPAGLLGLDIVRLGQASVASGLAEPVVMSALLPGATALWGFGLWWFVAAAVVLRRGYDSLPFGLSWWGFTFPTAAWTIATLVLGRVWDSQLLTWIGWVATAMVLGLWTYVAARTVSGIRRATIWSH